MNKTLSIMVANVQNEVQDTSTSFQSLVKQYINNRYFQVLRTLNYQAIRDDYTFSATAGTAKFVMPDDFGKALSVRDSTNGIELSEMDIQKLISVYPDSLTTQGEVERYVISEEPVRANPTSASVIALTSSSASDTTQTITVRGISGGYETYESVLLTGTSAASSTNSYTRIIGLSKSDATTGYVTATSNSAAVTIAVLAPEVLISRCRLMRLHYVPSSTVTIAMPYIIKPLPLNDDYDYPIIAIEDILEAGAKADAWRYKRMFAKAAVFEAMFTSLLADFVWDKENSPNQITQFTPSTYNGDNLY